MNQGPHSDRRCSCGGISTRVCGHAAARYDLSLEHVADGAPIPGSFWGEPEAGVIGEKVYARGDTPVHSLLHEACHLIVGRSRTGAHIHTDASDSQAEEDATAAICRSSLAIAFPARP